MSPKNPYQINLTKEKQITNFLSHSHAYIPPLCFKAPGEKSLEVRGHFGEDELDHATPTDWLIDCSLKKLR